MSMTDTLLQQILTELQALKTSIEASSGVTQGYNQYLLTLSSGNFTVNVTHTFTLGDMVVSILLVVLIALVLFRMFFAASRGLAL